MDVFLNPEFSDFLYLIVWCVQEVSEAYEVLADEGKRAEFDQFGSGSAQDPFSQGQTFSGSFSRKSFFSHFKYLFLLFFRCTRITAQTSKKFVKILENLPLN